MAATKQSPIERARHIQRTFGTFKAARFMAKRGWSLEGALWILCHSMRDRQDVVATGD